MSPPSDLASDPFDLIRYFARFLLVLGTLAAVGLWLTGIAPRALLFASALWSIYGLVHAVLDGLLDPLIDFATQAVQNIGLAPSGRSYSLIEGMVARNEHDTAAAAYRQLADQGDPEAMARRAALLAGPLRVPTQARIELEEFREQQRLGTAADIRIGLALADVYEHALDDPGHAMREIRRLLDRYPHQRGLRYIRRTLAALKTQRFGPAS
jgi:hypothetical protein